MSPSAVGPVLRPKTIGDVQEIVRAHRAVFPRGAGTKTALATPPPDATVLDLSGVVGIVEYDPAEFTFTARAGTPVREIQQTLADHGQELPFDPPLAAAGATLGGAVASGLSGPGRYRYGGVRDFILGVRFVDGLGNLVRGGGKVVKNAAGFDFPKLMVGSLGRLGVLVELTFKVFPAPRAHATVRAEFPRLEEAVEVLARLLLSPFNLVALDLEPPGVLWVRIGGLPESLPARLDRLVAFLDGDAEVLRGAEEVGVWERAREFAWVPPRWALVKVPTTPRHILQLEERLSGIEALRRYSAGGAVAWVACPGDPQALHGVLGELGLAGLRVLGPPGPPILGAWAGAAFGRRVKRALDPDGRFGPLPVPEGS